MGALTIILAVFILGILIFLHELGHFLAAKRGGFIVEIFSIGIGPTLVRFTRGGTEYCVKAIPWAGYVKLRGEDQEDKNPSPDDFEGKSPWKRVRVLIAGPLMNLILPVFLMPCVFMLGMRIPAYLSEEPVIGWVAQDSPAEKAGLRPGDKVVALGGKKVSNWEDLQSIVLSHPGKELQLEVSRGRASGDQGRVAEKIIKVKEMEMGGAGDIGAFPPMAPVLGRVRKASPASSAGLQGGDRILSVDGRHISHWAEMAQIIRKNPDRSIIMLVDRGGKQLTVSVTPKKDEQAGGAVIGVEREERTVLKKMGIGEAFVEGEKQVAKYSGLVFFILWKLISGQLSVNTLGGPIAIADFTAQAAKAGLSRLLDLVSFISLQLGILNLFPIPMLDGGHLFFILLEIVFRKKVSARKREFARYIGFTFLVGLMVLVTINDIIRMWGDDFIRFFRAVMKAFT